MQNYIILLKQTNFSSIIYHHSQHYIKNTLPKRHSFPQQQMRAEGIITFYYLLRMYIAQLINNFDKKNNWRSPKS